MALSCSVAISCLLLIQFELDYMHCLKLMTRFAQVTARYYSGCSLLVLVKWTVATRVVPSRYYGQPHIVTCCRTVAAASVIGDDQL